ncbi:MAG: hypothetical protein ABIY55_30250 [Kofleriaceae bacterium]
MVSLLGELVLGWFSYRSLDSHVALAAMCGLPVLVLLDWVARFTGSDAHPRWYRPYLAAWCLVPFVCVIAGSLWLHYQKRQTGLDELGSLALDLRRTVAEATPEPPRPNPWSAQVFELDFLGTRFRVPYCAWFAPGGVTGSEINAAVETLAVRAGPSFLSDEGRQFRSIARAVGEDLRRACGNVPIVQQRIADDTLTDFALSFAVQAVFVLWIPVLLAVTIGRANGRPRRRGAQSACESLHTRDTLILAEDRALFLPRLCFGALMALGTTYVFSPFGLKATSMMAVINEHGPPGHATWALWCTSFHEVPVLVVGFVGFLLYALITATQRFALDDFDDRGLLSLLVRGLVVILLSFALSGSSLDETASRLFVFVAGVFPLRALEALAKKVNIAMEGELEAQSGSFEGLPSLDSSKVFALRSAGIQSTYDLAATPLEEIAERVRIDPRLLGRAVDRAILIDAMGISLARRLEPFAITSATELVALKDNLPMLIEAPTASSTPSVATPAAPAAASSPPPALQLHDAAAAAAQRLAIDRRVALVRTWLAGASSFDGLHLHESIEIRLRAAGLWSTEELLAKPLPILAELTHLARPDLATLLDRALLVDSAGLTLAQLLEPFQICTATVLLRRASEPGLQTILGNSQAGILQRIAQHDRLADIQQYARPADPSYVI